MKMFRHSHLSRSLRDCFFIYYFLLVRAFIVVESKDVGPN